MTIRDANANDLTDFLDLDAMRRGQPTFPELPQLPSAGNTPARLACSKTGPGQIPPPLPAPRVVLLSVRVKRARRRVAVELQTDHGTLNDLEVTLSHRRRVVARHRVVSLGPHVDRVILPSLGRLRRAGQYTLTVVQGRRTLARQTVNVG